jgi:PAS domain S-box-containing protein
MIFDASTDAIAVHDMSTGAIIDVNQTLCELYGYSYEEVVQLSVNDISLGEPPYSQSEAQEWIRKAAEAGPQRFQWHSRRRNGELFWAEVVLKRLHVGDRECILAFVRDITSFKQAEEEILRRGEIERALLNAPPETIFLMSCDGRVEAINETGARRLGMAVEEVIGCNAFDLLPPANPATNKTLIGDVVETGQQSSYEAKRGKLCLDSTVLPVFGADGKVERIAVIARDITVQKQTESERRRLETRFQQSQKMESLGLLTGGIAHDFNNLLVGIMDNADLAMNEVDPKTPTCQYVENILDATLRAAELTTQVVDFAKKGKLEIELINLSPVVQEMSLLLGSSITRRVRLMLDLASGLPPVAANATQIRQVVMNLLLNASQAIGDRRGTVWISTSFLKSRQQLGQGSAGPAVCLEVRDNGSGMDEETQAEIFDPFFTTKSTGGGLGLAAVLSIVRSYRGTISVDSKLGTGTTMKVLLPVAEPGSASQATGVTTGQDPLFP